MIRRHTLPLAAALCIALSGLLATSVFAADTYKGWEKNSEYNALYNYKERDSLKGKLLKFKKVTPLSGMDSGTAFILQEGDEEILVHLCPSEYADPQQTGLRKGVKTKVKGAWAVIDNTDVFIASKAKQGEDFEFKVRLTKDGTPFWTMSAEELAKETGE
jgi:hypothetical protein